MIDKGLLRQQIVDNLTVDLNIAMQAAHVAHAAAICKETQPENKYDTLSLESTYIDNYRFFSYTTKSNMYKMHHLDKATKN